MWVIVMEYIEGGNMFDLSILSVGQKDNLRMAVKLLHDNEFVFGDLREPNIIVRGGTELYLIDFDWCGTSQYG